MLVDADCPHAKFEEDEEVEALTEREDVAGNREFETNDDSWKIASKVMRRGRRGPVSCQEEVHRERLPSGPHRRIKEEEAPEERQRSTSRRMSFP